MPCENGTKKIDQFNAFLKEERIRIEIQVGHRHSCMKRSRNKTVKALRFLFEFEITEIFFYAFAGNY